MHILNIYSIYFQNILNMYSMYEYNIPFNKHFKKILRNGFLQNDGNGTSKMAILIGYLQPAEPCKHPKNNERKSY